MAPEARAGSEADTPGCWQARLGVWPGRRYVPGMVAPRGGEARGAACSAPRRPPACLPRRCAMDPLFAKVAGLDVHLKSIACAARGRQDSGKLLRQVRSVGTMTGDRRARADWLQTLGVTHVALEATGGLWRPAWNVLGGRFPLLLVNPRPLKKVPGRKTDVSDAAGVAQLLQGGRRKGRFVP